MKQTTLAILLLALLLAGCSPKTLTISDAWARSASAGENSAIYLVIDNPTDAQDTLLSATSDAAASLELHMSAMDANSMMTMQHQEMVPVPAGGQVVFEPGGLHIMLVGLTRDLTAQDTLTVTLNFQIAGEMTLAVPVREP